MLILMGARAPPRGGAGADFLEPMLTSRVAALLEHPSSKLPVQPKYCYLWYPLNSLSPGIREPKLTFPVNNIVRAMVA
jgi:hypothetical protein